MTVEELDLHTTVRGDAGVGGGLGVTGRGKRNSTQRE